MNDITEEHIRQSNLIENINDPAEIDQSMVAWEILKQAETQTHGLICQVQKVITLNQRDLRAHERGYYRDMAQVNVRVGSYFPPDYGAVPGMMDNWLLDYDELGPGEAHRRFEHVHPFVDGNGRTGRMLMWQEIKTGQEPTLIMAAERQAYYRSLAK